MCLEKPTIPPQDSIGHQGARYHWTVQGPSETTMAPRHPHRNSLDAWVAYQRTSLEGDVRKVFEFWVEYVQVHREHPTNFMLVKFVGKNHPEFIAESVHKRTVTLKDLGILKEGPDRRNPTGRMAHSLIPGDGEVTCIQNELDYYTRWWHIAWRVPDEVKSQWRWKDWCLMLGGQRGVKGCEKTLSKMWRLFEAGLIRWNVNEQRMERCESAGGNRARNAS